MRWNSAPRLDLGVAVRLIIEQEQRTQAEATAAREGNQPESSTVLHYRLEDSSRRLGKIESRLLAAESPPAAIMALIHGTLIQPRLAGRCDLPMGIVVLAPTRFA
jgi:predicted XRE-type DNA-binding protein